MSLMQITQTIQIIPPVQSKRGKRTSQPMLPGMHEKVIAPPTITNRQIAEVLSSIADLVEKQKGNPYRIQAYRNAARGILELTEPATAILERGAALPIPGLGTRLRTRIAELIQRGSITFNHGFFMETLPQGVHALMAVEHIGPYTAIRLYDELGIDSPEKLWWAAQQQRIRQLSGFGTRSEARLKLAVEQLLKGKKRIPLDGAA